jgi:hypothetical protein
MTRTGRSPPARTPSNVPCASVNWLGEQFNGEHAPAGASTGTSAASSTAIRSRRFTLPS